MAKQVISVFSGLTTVGVTLTDWIANVDFFILTANIAPDEFIENDAILEIDVTAETGQIKAIPIPGEYVSTSAVLYVPQEIARSGLPVRLALLVSEPYQLQVLAVLYQDDFQQWLTNKLEAIENKIIAACSGGYSPRLPTMLP
jgi:hypothetical protein